jgi:FKBP12-rapamycin complex-associated protein
MLNGSPENLIESTAKTTDRVMFSTFQYWWSNGEKQRALTELTAFLKISSHILPHTKDEVSFKVRCLLKRATWMRELEDGDVHEILETLREARDLAENEYSVWHAWAVANYDQLKRTDTKESAIIVDEDSSSIPPTFVSPPMHNGKFKRSETPPSHPKVVSKANYMTPKKLNNNTVGAASLLNFVSGQQADKAAPYVIEAIKGFVKSIVLGQGQPVANLLQDILRLITLWFSYGMKKGVLQILEAELEKVSPDNWLGVIPQLIARIHIKSPEISGSLRKLLIKVAGAHPQALVCPISVALNTNDHQQKIVSSEVLREVRKNRKELVEDATLFSTELMRVAITPYELWYDGLEQAAQCYMDNKDISSMVSVLRELHETMNETTSNTSSQYRKVEGFSESMSKIGHKTLRDISFRHSYGKHLADAQYWLDKFRNSGRTIDLHQAWEIYQAIFKKIKAQINNLKKIELHHVSPALTAAKNLSLAVPGTYRPGSPDVCITNFSPSVHVIASKQRPRRMSMFGTDGNRYQFLLKGHEDLRQDERVMQLFGLINVCLKNDRITNEKGLNIVRYSVLPLSNNSGVIGWVENCDTINQLVKQYREAKDIRLLVELKLLQSKCTNYDKLPLVHKVDIFRQVLEETTGDDLAKMLWLKSKTSDVWIERRANFTKSLAVMSMVGYILGLGDRHPSNLMLHQISGQVVHIDFGDCFEITAHRAKYPEIIPFRLTRMLTKCMESAGIQGTYRITCERVSCHLFLKMTISFNLFIVFVLLGYASSSRKSGQRHGDA